MAKENKKRKLALTLYKESDLTQKEIADQIDVTEATISKWAHEGNWKELKAIETMSPDKLMRELYLQCDKIIETARDESRALNSKEADALVKLSTAIKSLDKRINPSIVYGVFMRFGKFTKAIDPEFTKKLTQYQNDFIMTEL